MTGAHAKELLPESEPNWPLWKEYLDYAAKTDLGLRRANNQDNLAVDLATSLEDFQHRGHLFLVADGMGAHAAGEKASEMAAKEIPFTYRKHPSPDCAEALQKAIEEANQKIHRLGEENEDFHGMGTTVSALALLPQGALVAHVGDSRVYRLRGSLLEQLTFDHSLGWTLYREQPKTDIPPGIPKNIILRSLGPRPTVEVDLEGYYPLEPGDKFLICTDGLSGPVSNEEIGVLLQCLPLREALQVFVDLANLRGGPDNITGIVVQVRAPIHGKSLKVGASRPSPSGTSPSGKRGLWSKLFGWLPFPRAKKKHWGNAPYQKLECIPGPPVAEALQKEVQGLRNAAANNQWQIEWETFNRNESAAQTAFQNNQFKEAIRHFSQAILDMMHQLREQRPKG